MTRGMLGLIGFACMVGLSAVLNQWYGQTAVFRFWGVSVALGALLLSLKREIPVYIGNDYLMATFKGWKKVFLLLPLFCIGLSVALYPHEIACTVHLKGYKCI